VSRVREGAAGGRGNESAGRTGTAEGRRTSGRTGAAEWSRLELQRGGWAVYTGGEQAVNSSWRPSRAISHADAEANGFDGGAEVGAEFDFF
jgi:hypothetical protein